MKQLRTVITALLLLCSTVATAHDFEVDGIYYNILSQVDKTAEVTYKGEYSDSYSNEYSGDVTIPANVIYDGASYSVTTIRDYAFRDCSSLTSIEIPGSVTTIGEWAFYYCISLKSIEIPNSVKNIGDYAFHYCVSLTSIKIPNSVTTIGYNTFSVCSSLTSITIPNSVTTIGGGAFAVCSSLKSIEIPNSVTTIGEGAFNGCESLTSIVIPNSVTSIGKYALGACNSLTSISVAGGNTTYDSRYNCNAIIESATNTLVAGCQNTVIPNSVTSIGETAFYECNSLTGIEIPNSVTTIGDYAFCGCSLTSIVIPNSVTTIGNSAFSSCYGLTSIEIPNSVTSIGKHAFRDCRSLTSIEIPNSVTTIEDHALYYCISLTSIVIPNSVTTIGEWAFYGCESLTSIEIPNSVTTIGDYAFYSCNNLTTITSLIPATELFAVESNVFEGVSNDCTLYVPYGAKETYAATSGWSEFTNIVELPAEAFNLTVSAAKYSTLYLDFDAVIPQGVEVYTASTVDGDRLMMQEVTGILPANTGVIVRAEQGTYTFEQSKESGSAIENNLLCGSAEDVYITPAKGVKYYVLSMKDGVVGMYEDALSGGTFKNNAHKAYLVLGEKNLGIYDEEVDTEDPGMQLSNSYYFDFGGTTAIDPVVTEVNDNIYYDLSGRRVENPTRGIYILNGKKILVK